MELIKKIWKKILNNKLLAIILLATFLRIFLLNKIPPSLNWDETAMGYTAYSVLKTAKDEWGQKLPIFFRSYGEWKSAVYIYLLVPFIKVFGLNAWAVRLPTSLAGVAAVYLTYLITEKIFSKKAGIFAALFLAISPWHLALSRPAFEAGISLATGLAGVYFLILASEKPNLKNIALSALFFGLGPHTYNSSKIITPFLVLWLVYQLRKKITWKKLIVFFAILGIFAFPIAKNILSGKAQHRYSQVGVTTDLNLQKEFYGFRKTFPIPEKYNRFLFNKYTLFNYKLTDNWATYFSPSFLIISGGGHTQHQVPYRGILYISEFLLALYALPKLFKGKNKDKLNYLPLVIIGLGFIPPATTRETHHVLRSILALPGFQILAGVGLAQFLKENKKKQKLKKGLLALLAFEAITLFLMYFTWYPTEYSEDWQYGYKQAIEYTEKHKDEYDEVVFTKWYGEPQVFLAFHSKMDPVKYQKENKPLLRYEDLGHIWLDQLEEYRIGKYTFRYIEWTGEKQSGSNKLYVGKADDFYPDTKVLKTINFKDGHPAFKIVEGK